MKITIKPKEPETLKTTGNEPLGTIIKMRNLVNIDGVPALVIEGNKILLLNDSAGKTWLAIAKDYFIHYKTGNYKVLGKLKEIIVQ